MPTTALATDKGGGWQAVPLAGAQNSQSAVSSGPHLVCERHSESQWCDIEDWTLPESGPALGDSHTVSAGLNDITERAAL